MFKYQCLYFARMKVMYGRVTIETETSSDLAKTSRKSKRLFLDLLL